jgi:hypothetical protein
VEFVVDKPALRPLISQYFSCPCKYIPQILHSNLHINTTVIRWTSGPKLGTFKRSGALSYIGAVKIEVLPTSPHSLGNAGAFCDGSGRPTASDPALLLLVSSGSDVSVQLIIGH